MGILDWGLGYFIDGIAAGDEAKNPSDPIFRPDESNGDWMYNIWASNYVAPRGGSSLRGGTPFDTSTPEVNAVRGDNIRGGGAFHPNITQSRSNTIDPVDNILSKYESYTYKWTLYAADTRLHNGETKWANYPKVTIAESGASAQFFLDEMSVTSYTSINSMTRTMPHTGFNFTIHEPKGAAFMDKMYNTGQAIGTKNHIKVPYYLELEFLDESLTHIPGAGFIWSINIIEMKTSVTADGATYIFDAISTDDFATTNHFAIIPATLSVSATTIGEFFNKLEAKLNDYQALTVGLYISEADKYVFNVDPEIASLEMVSNMEFSNNQMESFGESSIEDHVITVPKGYDIATISENLMVACDAWYHNISIPEEAREATSLVEHRGRVDFSRYWKIETNINYKTYDTLRRDYQIEVVYNIIPYKTVRSNPNLGDQKDWIDSRNKNIINTFEVKKAYDYLFTGLNTEVLNFDFNMDLLWFSPLPNKGGEPNELDTGPSTDTTPSFLAAQSVRMSNAVTLTSAIESLDLSSGSGRAESLFASEELSATTNSILTAPNPFVDNMNILEIRAQNTLNNGGRITKSSFVEDLPNVRIPTSNGYLGTVQSLNVNPERPELAKNFGVKGRNTFEKAFIAASLEYHGSAEMTNITIEIKGDPFWIGASKLMRKQSALATNMFIPKTSLASDMYTDYTYQDNLFVLNMNSPKLENDTLGLYESVNNQLYTGYYQVISVTHTFSGGRFTQELTATKDMLSNPTAAGVRF